jgi:peptidoglycan/LPS O-acetylase OafA/YrhL
MQEQIGPSVHVRYRPDIDGLRALAVILVLMNHLETHMTGGYVGVDVFFVISGYLISANILSDMVAGKFTIVGFYERRVRRIFPALLVMLLVVTLLAYRYLIPSEVEDYSRSLLAALLSGSNFFFWHKGGYFDQPDLEPLLHTWSLGVEEQFYILFPLLLVMIRRWFPRKLRPAIIGISVVSFIAACLTVRSHAIAAFFFAPLRAWELLMGTIVSQKYIPSLRGSLARNLASGAGLLLIMVPGFKYDDLTVFPGWTALPPCLGDGVFFGGPAAGLASYCFHRVDLLLALPLALADHCVPECRRHGDARRNPHTLDQGRHFGIVNCGRHTIVAICRAAVPFGKISSGEARCLRN